MSMMEYKGYIAKIVYDAESESFQGVTVNMAGELSFYGYSADELKTNFHDAVDSYMAICAEKGIPPRKPFSGKFNVRLDPALHARAALAAAEKDMSLNAFVAQAVSESAEETMRS